jgi:hypothetical protein
MKRGDKNLHLNFCRFPELCAAIFQVSSIASDEVKCSEAMESRETLTIDSEAQVVDDQNSRTAGSA